MRQIGRIGQHLALVARIFVENIDALADDIVGGDALGKQILNLPERGDAGLVGIGDVEGRRIAEHNVSRQVVDQLAIGLYVKAVGGAMGGF